MTLISFKSVLLKAEFWFCLEVIALWLLHASTANQTGFKKFQGLTISKYSLSKSILVSVDRKYFLIRFRSFNLFFFLLVYFKVFCSSKWPVCFFSPPILVAKREFLTGENSEKFCHFSSRNCQEDIILQFIVTDTGYIIWIKITCFHLSQVQNPLCSLFLMLSLRCLSDTLGLPQSEVE